MPRRPRRAAKTSVGALCSLAFASSALAQSTPAGLWKTIDEETKQETSLVRITEEAGVFRGVIEKLLNPARPDPVCGKCTDERRDKPILGMTILRDVRHSADDQGLWDGGDILEVKTGKVYNVQLRLADGGRTLQVHVYAGSPLLGRTKRWMRIG